MAEFITVEMARLDGRRRTMLSSATVPAARRPRGADGWRAGPFGGLPSDGRFEFTVRQGARRIISRVVATQRDGRTHWRTIR